MWFSAGTFSIPEVKTCTFRGKKESKIKLTS